MDGYQCFRVRGAAEEPALLLTRSPRDGNPVLYLHGATFPAALSVCYRFGGRSWTDDLNARGFDAWALDFAGYGGSDRYPQMSQDVVGEPPGQAIECSEQIARAVEQMVDVTGHSRVALVAHSWGTMAAALYAARHPERIAWLCLFGPIARRGGAQGADQPLRRWRLVTIAEQLARFVAEVPKDHLPVLIEPELHDWGPAYLATDPEAASRTPQAVKVPNGPEADVRAAWSGNLAWRPQDIRCPTLVVRGEWDSVTSAADVDWLLARIAHPVRRAATIAKGTHLMHLEHSREGLFEAVGAFLKEAP
jgi:pimeloyl-ACP methyl ester carboxylesterase